MELTMMEKFCDPELFHTLSLSDKLAGAGITTVMGMATTFAVLILLWGIISVMCKVFNKAAGKPNKPDKTKNVAAAAGSAPSCSSVADSCEVISQVDDSKLASVIMAAILAYEGDDAKSNLVIRKIS
ncbi:MAG: OadG family protein, partial [Anaerovorax sp.]